VRAAQSFRADVTEVATAPVQYFEIVTRILPSNTADPAVNLWMTAKCLPEQWTKEASIKRQPIRGSRFRAAAAEG